MAGKTLFELYYTSGALPDNTWQEWDVDTLTISVNGDGITYNFEPSFYTLTLSDPDATINMAIQ